ncbi:ABC transporter permease [Nonomuraea roseoviolacea]|uniref:Peptide/nickel transport system permease protein n=1 Tax=Nonomuraea roseoviolacea subsp. carminata TaxID=160689 RepID=A0ABT1KEJ6_9ACTN|nr:ABC transporter permease [Nonomuraea roseoviolacea]MCP2352441.1 peptide/nickel transport system permease protein [Nonomuraea roseoviolacea subsp. carminata]
MTGITVARRAGAGTIRRAGLGPLGTAAAGVVVVAVVLAVLGPALSPADPNASDFASAYAPPAPGHPLGFDGQGRDLLARLLEGARTSLLGPLLVVALSMAAGTALAIAAAWAGGWLDAAVSAALEVVFAFPGVLLAMLVAAVFGPGLGAAVVALAVAYVPYIARLLRGAALAERGKPYVRALEVQGAGALAICLRHLVPNLLPLIAAQATLFFGYAMVDLAIVSFFGLGVQPPDADWGVMVASGRSGVLQGYPAEALLAGGCVVVLVVAFNVLGERLPGAAGAGGRPWRRTGLRTGRRTGRRGGAA